MSITTKEIPDTVLLNAFRDSIRAEIERQLWADVQPIIDAARQKVKAAAEKAVAELDAVVRSQYDIHAGHAVHAVLLKIKEPKA